jgi:uncharacterized phage infection (PIP) family protein YhgE
MPSLSDVFKELQNANGRLDTLHVDLQQLSNQLHALRNDTSTGFGNTVKTLNTGFTALTQGVQAVIALQIFTNDVLLHHAKQHDTMICILEHISKNTCHLVTEAHVQTGLQTSIEKGISMQTELLKSANAEAALQLERMDTLRKRVEECCPPEQELPACTYEPCATSRFEGEAPRPRAPSFEPVVREPRPPG